VTDPQKPPRGRRSASRGERDPRLAADDERTADQRLADHAAIDRLTEDLLPALAAKLSATGLAEIEVGEGSWTVRVRRPPDGAPGHSRRVTDRPSRSQPGHAGHGHAPGGFEGHRSARETKATTAAFSTNGSTPTTEPASPGPAAPAGSRPTDESPDRYRVVATSPAVGVFQPRAEAKSGTRVRSGDRLGAVDMLGIPQEVVAPADGIVGASLVEAGQTVEYGQELVIIELAGRAAERSEA
jgi:biotin carboxyl carrier protein